MPLIDLSAAPSPSMRRWFGASLGLLLLIFAWLSRSLGVWPSALLFGCAVVTTSVYYALPATQEKIIRGWQWLTFPIAFLIGHLLFGAIYFVVLTPLAMALRVVGHDALRLRERHRASTWQDRKQDVAAEQYLKQF
ncbi:SxtJ family membrane protein [Rhodopirellula sp. JC740]|uniref:SxtJ family membrane protein n=1 Tax=Rhodopirellula halodulae TaxID=2894198 RepID=A0ABS8NGT0_9BACT|nr:SxtJ family membrane protein [Rhodopirellula sp. JC740]MCC9642764.1 SxtJ family membrane protein [Rhodopirellula sp. JC740]